MSLKLRKKMVLDNTAKKQQNKNKNQFRTFISKSASKDSCNDQT